MSGLNLVNRFIYTNDFIAVHLGHGIKTIQDDLSVLTGKGLDLLFSTGVRSHFVGIDEAQQAE